MIGWQEKYAELQDKLLTSTAAMTRASEGVKLAIDLVESAQQRGNNALATILGSSYKIADFAFYGSGFITLVVAGWHVQLQQARVPIFILYLLCIGVERSVLVWISPRLKVMTWPEPACCY